LPLDDDGASPPAALCLHFFAAGGMCARSVIRADTERERRRRELGRMNVNYRHGALVEHV